MNDIIEDVNHVITNIDLYRLFRITVFRERFK